MSKAEDLTKELYPLLETDKIGNNPYITYNTEQLAKQEGFVKGYHQAEKDLELTWEDISLLRSILFDVEHKGFTNFPYEEFCKEVLKRFNKQRNDRH